MKVTGQTVGQNKVEAIKTEQNKKNMKKRKDARGVSHGHAFWDPYYSSMFYYNTELDSNHP